ncbi:uncharacterized protein RSE6_04266 [Rhynchosporium secalis]|uniref:BZIP transcription factor n=1 Tax=Rhynchosporium secalis TaxID=38038 RepID=A0A1E1M4W3_RHYSE|nr:uncharacterized protein RSE6_04266 [Rhynchosporium secalis]
MAGEHLSRPGLEEAVDIDESPTNKPGAKRRASRAGTRSVASLTPDQLARKRANDREAQVRSVQVHPPEDEDTQCVMETPVFYSYFPRETRFILFSGHLQENVYLPGLLTVEELEQRIRDLSRDQDARNFEQIKRRNEELEVELKQLSGLLGHSESSFGTSPELNFSSVESRYSTDILTEPHPLVYSPNWSGQQHIEEMSSPYLSHPQSSAGDLLSPYAPDPSGLPSGFSDPGSGRSQTFNQAEVGLRDVMNPQPVPDPMPQRCHSPRPQVSRTVPSVDLPLGMDAYVDGIGSHVALADQSTSPVNRPMRISATGLHQSHPPTANPLTLNQRTNTAGHQQPNDNGYEVPGPMIGVSAWDLPLRLLPPSGPVAIILHGLVDRQRNIATEHAHGSHPTGPYHPDLRPMLGPRRGHRIHPVSSTISELFKRLVYVGFAERAAALLLVYHFVQWQILPAKETYQNIPEWFRPRASALAIAHPLWTSFLVWEGLRDVVIRDQQRYATEEFMNLYQNCITINWPFRDEDIVVYVGDEVRVNDAFKRHIETQANWSLGEPFHRRYPELRGLYRLS